MTFTERLPIDEETSVFDVRIDLEDDRDGAIKELERVLPNMAFSHWLGQILRIFKGK